MDKGKEVTTEEKIKTLYKLSDEVQALSEKESDEYKKALVDRDEEVYIKREGKKVKVKLAELWEEVRHLGLKSKSADFLKQKYPLVFELAEKLQVANTKLQAFIVKEFGFDFKMMKITDYLRLTEMVFEYKMKQFMEKNEKN